MKRTRGKTDGEWPRPSRCCSESRRRRFPLIHSSRRRRSRKQPACSRKLRSPDASITARLKKNCHHGAVIRRHRHGVLPQRGTLLEMKQSTRSRARDGRLPRHRGGQDIPVTTGRPPLVVAAADCWVEEIRNRVDFRSCSPHSTSKQEGQAGMPVLLS